MISLSFRSELGFYLADSHHPGCVGARGVRCLRDGHPAGRHAECEDCQQHVGEGDLQCWLQRRSGGLCYSGLRLQGGTPPGISILSPPSCLISDILTLLQIDDDENVAETVLVEIHADNDESFVDKNVTFTMYKIGESPGGE